MYVPTSLIILGITKILPFALRKSGWRSKSELHRNALGSIKKGNLEEAIKYNLKSREKKTDYEKALILRDVILMNIDANRNKINGEYEEAKQSFNKTEENLYKVTSELRDRYSHKTKLVFLRIISAVVCLLMLFSGMKVSLETYAASPLIIAIILSGIFLRQVYSIQWSLHTIQLNKVLHLLNKHKKLKDEIEAKESKLFELKAEQNHFITLKERLLGGYS